jgi:transglycosylase-like protein with SLT domain
VLVAALAPLASARAEPDKEPARPTVDEICRTLADAATDNDLPEEFFTRLIWQESRFDPSAVSPAGAQGIAQFMPATARSRGLFDPFDPLKAIPKSAELLRDLVDQFGNLGLAAAAYNAGPGRIMQWLTGRKALPKETQDYVRIITGRPAEDWTSTEPSGDPALKKLPPCDDLLAIAQAEVRIRRAAPPKPPAPRPAMIALRSTQQRHGVQAKAEPKVAPQRPVRVAEARDTRSQARPRPNPPAEARDIRSHANPRLHTVAEVRDTRSHAAPRLNLVAERAHAGRPKRLAHSM